MSSELPSSSLNTLEILTIDGKSIEISSSQPPTTPMENPPTSHVTPHTIPVDVTKQGPTTIEDLPNELLVNILSHLDTEAPSHSHTILHDEPTLNVTTSEVRDLKNCSLISKRWRQPTLPLLFKYTRYILKYSEDDSRPILNDLTGPFLQFLHTQSLAGIVSSFTLVVREGKISNCFDGIPRCREFDSFWQRLFHMIDPSTILIAAPAAALASLTSAVISVMEAWLFGIECHYLRLQRPASKEAIVTEVTEREDPTELPQSLAETSGPLSRTSLLTVPDFDERLHYTLGTTTIPQTYAKSSEIFQIRPWTSLLLNEGSNLKAYKSSLWWELDTPSILGNLVGINDAIPLINSSIRSMRYIAIFPITTNHFEYLAQKLPRLDHLYVQLVPRNDVLEDEELKNKIDFDDLWMERNNCYAQLMREMFNDPPDANYRYLKTFESGDAADTDAWQMAVEFVKRAGGGWKITGDGIFEKDTVSEDSSSNASHPSPPFPKQLYRWAWNGTAKLPVSPVARYR
ncbi:hypothetical protein OCU04_011127 [Sclerotinia nivalis]|uniref:F-box domain-containing protein n=1 Tax=Sclerotinia nivalis TaxID=352851 RepID=A0A9X0AAV8_9HELO|nr:hypothetical protein OCU04_011127 [Sclerotinia nivalis]